MKIFLLPLSLVTAILAALLFWGAVPAESQLARCWLNWLHLPLYAAAYVLLRCSWRKALPPARADRLAAAVMIFFALATELLQPLFGRSMDGLDIVRNLLGVGLGWAVTGGLRRQIAGRNLRGGCSLVLVFACAWITALPFVATKAALDAKGRFPVFFSGRESEVGLWSRSEGVSWSFGEPQKGSADRPLQLEFAGDGWPGVTLFVAHSDWSDYASLTLSARSIGEPFRLGVRIDYHGEIHPRQYFELELVEQYLERSITLEDLPAKDGIARLVLFAEGGSLAKGATIARIELR